VFHIPLPFIQTFPELSSNLRLLRSIFPHLCFLFLSNICKIVLFCSIERRCRGAGSHLGQGRHQGVIQRIRTCAQCSHTHHRDSTTQHNDGTAQHKDSITYHEHPYRYPGSLAPVMARCRRVCVSVYVCLCVCVCVCVALRYTLRTTHFIFPLTPHTSHRFPNTARTFCIRSSI
jgi:hypothetical protein